MTARLTYVNGRGLAEVVRIALAAAEIPVRLCLELGIRAMDIRHRSVTCNPINSMSTGSRFSSLQLRSK